MTEVGNKLTLVEEPTSPATVVDLVRLALEKGLGVEALERLQAMHERASDRAAAAEFAYAMAKFQEQVGPIKRNKTAEFDSRRTGGKVSYSYAELDFIAREIKQPLIENGLSYSWDSKVQGSDMTAICTVRHVNGHSQSSSFTCPTTSDTPAMSPQQKYASALQFAKRQSLVQVLGLTTTDEDDDAADPTTITEEQANDLAALLDEKGISVNRFLKWVDAASLTDIRASAYADCVTKVQQAKRPA